MEINQEIVGFGDLNSECYLEHLFVHKDFQRQKIASTIVEISKLIFPKDLLEQMSEKTNEKENLSVTENV